MAEKALNFDGSNDEAYDGVDSSNWMDGDSLSIECWIKVSDVTSGKPTQTGSIFSKTNCAVILFNSNGLIYFYHMNPTPAWRTAWSTGLSGSLVADQWYHIVCTQDKTNGTHIYIDGSSSLSGGSSTDGVEQNANHVLYVGSGNGTSFFKGVIEEMRVSDKERSQAEVTAAYNGGTGVELTDDVNTLALWHFNDEADPTDDETTDHDLDIDGATFVTGKDWLAALQKQNVGSGAITPTGALTSVLTIFKATGTGAITPAGVLGRNIFTSVGSGSITPTGILGRLTKIVVGVGEITPTGALAAARKFFLTVGEGAITPIGALNRLIKITVGSTAPEAGTETLRPNGVGNLTDIPVQYPDSDAHWEKVDEASSDGDDTYVEHPIGGGGTHGEYDLYALPAHSGLGTINSVTIYVVAKKTTTYGFARTYMRTHATNYSGTFTALTDSYAAYSKQYTTNPNTSSAWTWDEIDALEAGVGLQAADNRATRCTQVYVEVDYGEVGGITPTGALSTVLRFVQSVGQGAITPTGTLNTILKIFLTVGQGAVAIAGILGRLTKIAVGSGGITPSGTLTAVVKFFQAVGQGAVAIVGVLGRVIKITTGQGSLTPTGALSTVLRFLQTVGEGAVSMAGVLTRLPKIVVGQGSMGLVGTLGRFIKITAGQGAITPTGVLGRFIKIAVGAGSITPTGTLAAILRILKSVGQGAITPIGVLGRKIALTVGSGAITSAGALSTIKTIFKTVGQGAITPSGALGTVLTIFQTVGQGALTMAGTLTRLTKIIVGAGAITPSGTLGRLIKIVVGAGAVTPAGTLGRKISIAVGQGAVALAGVLTRLTKIIVGGGSITPTGSLYYGIVRKLTIRVITAGYRMTRTLTSLPMKLRSITTKGLLGDIRNLLKGG